MAEETSTPPRIAQSTNGATESAYLAAVARGVVVFDGAMGTNIQRHHPTAEDFGGKSLEGCNDHLVLTRPDIIQSIHESFLEVGCDVVETCTFQSTPHRLREWGIGEKTREVNVAAARLARAACDRYATPERPRFVAGSIGPTGLLLSSSDPVLSNTTFEALERNYYEQAKYLVEGGVDVLLIETAQDILEVKAALAGFQRLFDEIGRPVPVQAQVTLDTSGRMLLGTDIASAMTTLEALPIDIIGLNCSTGPEHMREPIRYLAGNASRPVSCIPNAGLPLNTGTGDAIYPLEPAPMADMLGEFVEQFGVRIVGGCCGTRPEHLAAIVDRVRAATRAKTGPPEAKPAPAAGSVRGSRVPRASSAMRAIDFDQNPKPLLIGERVNSQGSRKVKRLLLADDYEGIADVAREQLDSGAHVLDVCVALTERADEAEQMAKVVKLLSMTVETPIMVDSTEAVVVQRALEAIPGRGIINSINMENGRKRIDTVVPLAKRYGAALVALTIDEIGMAKTRDRKLEIAKKIFRIVVGEYGLAAGDLIYDDLTFTLATGDQEWIESAVETIEGIRLIKRELPGVFTSLGVSNVSFGLAPEARAVLNSVFLHHCVEAGLDMAIVNPAHVQPYAEIPASERALADDLVFNRRPDALQRFIEHYESRGGTGSARAAEVEDPMASMTPDQRVHYMVVHRKKDGIEAALDAAGVREQPVRVLNAVLLPAMKEVGDKFGAGELILPFVLQSAEVMKKAVKHLEQFLERAEGYTKGRVVLATVYGDVHDIGKSLVNTILSNNGYTVFDLGKQVPVNTIIEKALEVDADAIGLSALLVSTSKQMPLCVQELDRRGLKIPVLIGGAAINRRFGRRAMFVDGERAYDSGVFYCKDAFEGLETMDRLQDGETRANFLARLLDDARNDKFLSTTVGKDVAAGTSGGARSDVNTDNPIPTAPFFGVRTLDDIPLDEVFSLLDLDELYRLQWGARGSGEAYDAAIREFEPTRARLQESAKCDGWLRPRAVYGLFPAQSSGNDVIVYDADAYSQDGTTREIARFHFPRQDGRERLCIADYFRSVGSSDVDVVGFQIVTVGDAASERFQSLQTSGEYTEAYYVHGLAVETAEAVAEWMHRKIRHDLGLPGGQGKRYSWGYGACPDLEDHAQLFKILPAEQSLGMQLTSAFQLIPEQSTAAIIIHHPQAKYYAVRAEGAGAAPPPMNATIERLLDPEAIIVFDGAMGTMLYSKGVFINQCYDELNVRAPDLVRDIHAQYVKAGADVIETNSFGANRIKLVQHGLQDQVKELNRAAATVAREAADRRALVAGAVGPLGIRLEPYGPTSKDEARAIFKEQMEGLAEGGIDLFILETFSDLDEIEQAILAARAVDPKKPIIAQMTIGADGRTPYGAETDIVARKLDAWGADIIGLNCSVGPQTILECVEKMAPATRRKLSAQPNAGMPRDVGGRSMYMASPEYMATYARHLVQAGAKIVGGCCGTTPEHIHAIVEGIRPLTPRFAGTAVIHEPVPSTSGNGATVDRRPPASVEPVPFAERSHWAAKLAKAEFVSSVEIVPPRGVDASRMIADVRKLKDAGVDAVNVPDGPRAQSRMGALLTSVLIEQQVGIETVTHYACRDRNLLGMLSDLLGASAVGLRNLLVVTGDPPKMGPYPDATAVFDVDSIGLTNLVSHLNRGLDPGGNAIGQPTRFVIGVGVNPVAIDVGQEIRRFSWKVDAGAEFAITQPVFDAAQLEKFFERVGGQHIPVIAGIWPLVSVRNAEFLANEVPGVSVPEAVIARMRRANEKSKEHAVAEGIAVAREMFERVRPLVQGVQVSAPFGKVELALRVFE